MARAMGGDRARVMSQLSSQTQSKSMETKPNSEATAIDTSANRLLASPLREIEPSRTQRAQAHLRQFENPSQALVARPKGEVVFLALQLLLVARIGFRAVLASWSLGVDLGLKKAPCPQTIINWVMRLVMVRIDSARPAPGRAPRLPPLVTASLMIDISIGPGHRKIVAVLPVTPITISSLQSPLSGAGPLYGFPRGCLDRRNHCRAARSPHRRHGPSAAYLKDGGATCTSVALLLNKG